MCFAGAGSAASSGGNVISGTFSGAVSALMDSKRADYDRKVAYRSAKIFRIQAQQALARGEGDAARIGRDFAQLVGRQRAVLASTGFEVQAGDPVRLTEATLELGREEQAVARYNAHLDAWAATEAAVGAVQAGKLAEFSGQTSKIAGIAGAATSGFVNVGGRSGGGGINLSGIGNIGKIQTRATTRVPATGGPFAGGLTGIA